MISSSSILKKIFCNILISLILKFFIVRSSYILKYQNNVFFLILIDSLFKFYCYEKLVLSPNFVNATKSGHVPKRVLGINFEFASKM